MFFHIGHIQRFSWCVSVYVLLGPGDGDIFVDTFCGSTDIAFVSSGNSSVYELFVTLVTLIYLVAVAIHVPFHGGWHGQQL